MGIKVEELMVRDVYTLQSGDTIDMARDAMRSRHIHALPVVGAAGQPLGIITSTDLMGGPAGESPVASVMSENVKTIRRDAELGDAAHLMQDEHTHHVVVTAQNAVVGILSSFDFLKLMDGKRFVVHPLSP